MEKKYRSFYDYRIEAGLFRIIDAANYLGVSTKTIKRWDQSGAPLVAIRALEFMAGKADGWNGIKLRTGQIGQALTYDETYTAREIELIKYHRILSYLCGNEAARLGLDDNHRIIPKIVDINKFREAVEYREHLKYG